MQGVVFGCCYSFCCVCGMVYADGLVSQLLLDGFYPTCIVSSGWLASAIVCSFV